MEKQENNHSNYYEYITVLIIYATAWRRFRFLKLGYMLVRDQFKRIILEMKDVDQILNDFAKLDWELVSTENVKYFPDYNYIKKEYKLMKIDSILYLFFKRKYCIKKLIPKEGSDYTSIRIEGEEIEKLKNYPRFKDRGKSEISIKS